MEITDYIQILARRKWTIILTTVITALLAYIGSTLLPEVYTATSTVRVLAGFQGSINFLQFDIAYSDRLINTYINLGTSDPVLDELQEGLELSSIPKVELESISNSELIEIRVSDHNPVLSTDAANALAQILVERSRQIDAGSSTATTELIREELQRLENDLDQSLRQYESLAEEAIYDPFDNSFRVDVAGRLVDIKEQQIERLETDLARADTPEDLEVLQEELKQVEEELDEARTTFETLAVQVVNAPPSNVELVDPASRLISEQQRTYQLVLRDYLSALSTGEVVRIPTLYVVEPAQVPTSPSFPDTNLNTVAGSIAGLISGLALAFLFERLDTRLHTTDQIEATTGARTLALIPEGRRGQKNTLLLNHSDQHLEAFRRLAANILSLSINEEPLQSMLITSAGPMEGKTTIAANLAATFAEAKLKVVLIDANFRQPALHETFGRANEVGLSSILNGKATLADAIQETAIPSIHLVASGPQESNPVGLLDKTQMENLLQQLSEQFEVVLIDTPAFEIVADVAVLASLVNGVLLVVGHGQSKEEAVRATCQGLSMMRANLVGQIVNRAHPQAFPLSRARSAHGPPISDLARIGMPDRQRVDESPTILIVEDDRAMAKLVDTYLTRAGYETQIAYNGASALEFANNVNPALVILDVMLPKMDGFEVSRRLRQSAEMATIPIIMVTARTGIDDKTEGYLAGVDDYITKPFSSPELELRVAALLRRAAMASWTTGLGDMIPPRMEALGEAQNFSDGPAEHTDSANRTT